jgi:antitoxin component of RelBE/YafQ-DinJ toxin-antitoxin module
MTTTFQIRVDENLKKEFLTASKKKGLDGSMLIRYFMTSFTKKPDIVNFDIQESFFDEMIQDKKIVAKLERVSNKLDTL